MKRFWVFAAMAALLLLLSALPMGALAQGERPILVEMENSNAGGKPLDNGAWIVEERDNDLKALGAEARAYAKGSETRYDALSLDGDALQIDSRLCGVILRPGSGDQLQISYWGEAPQDFTCEATREDGRLLLRLEGPDADKTYVNVHEERFYNVFVLEVPAAVRSLALDAQVSVFRLSGLDLERMEAAYLGASVGVEGDALTGRYTMEGEEGWTRLSADSISAALDLKASQGWITVCAKQLTGAANLSVDQGWATVKGGAISGASLYADQGWVTVEAQSLADSTLSADQGWVTVNVDALSDSRLRADQGWVTVNSGSLSGVVSEAPGGWNTLEAGVIAGPVQMEGQWSSLGIKWRPNNLGLNVKGCSTPEGREFKPPKGMKKLSEGSYAVGSGTPLISVEGEWIEVEIAQ